MADLDISLIERITKPLARAGELIRDKDGAVVATVARDIYRGQPMQSDDLTFADGRRRVRGEPVPNAVLDHFRGR